MAFKVRKARIQDVQSIYDLLKHMAAKVLKGNNKAQIATDFVFQTFIFTPTSLD